MKKNQCLLSIVTAMVLLVVGCSSDRVGDDNKNIQQVIMRIQTLQAEGKIAGISGNDHGEISAYRVTAEIRDQAWFLPFVDVAKGCDPLFIAELKIGERNLDYLFCCDSIPCRFVAGFELKEGKWVKQAEVAK